MTDARLRSLELGDSIERLTRAAAADEQVASVLRSVLAAPGAAVETLAIAVVGLAAQVRDLESQVRQARGGA